MPPPDWGAIREDGTNYPGEDHPAMRSLKTGKPYYHQIMGINISGKKCRWISINSIPVVDSQTGLTHEVVVTFTDVSELRELYYQNRLSRERMEIAMKANIQTKIHSKIKKIADKIKQNPELARFMTILETRNLESNYLNNHIHLLCEVTSYIGYKLGWVTLNSLEKLIYISYLHDIFYADNLNPAPV